MSLQSRAAQTLDQIASLAFSEALGRDLPLIGRALDGAVDAFGFDDVIARITAALPGAGADPDALAAALNMVEGMSATSDDGVVSFRIVATEAAAVSLGALVVDQGGGALDLALSASATASIAATLDARFIYEVATDALTFVAADGDEVTLALDVALDAGGAARLGALDVLVVDTRDDAELSLVFGVNLASLSPADVDVSVVGTAGLGVSLHTVTPLNLLPTFHADVALAWDTADLAAAPTADLAFAVELRTLLDTLTQMLGPVAELLLNDGAVGDIIDALTDPLPIIDDGVRAVPFLLGGIDAIPDPDGDGVVTVLDLVGLYLRNQNAPDSALEALSAFAEALGVLRQLRDGTSGEGRIALGAVRLGPDGALSPFEAAITDGQLPAAFTETLLSATGAFTQAVQAAQGLVSTGNASLSDTALLSPGGVSIPLVENPALVLDILFAQLTGATQPVTVIAYDLPTQVFQAGIDQFFPIFGPVGVSLSADFYTQVGFQVGYDTAALTMADGRFIDGVYLSTGPLPTGTLLPGQNPDRPYDFMPIAFLYARAQLGAGVSIGIAELTVRGGPTGFAAASFTEERVRLADLAGCFLEVDGRVAAGLSIRAKVGFGPFSVSKSFTLVEATLVDFTFGCVEGGGGVQTGLASLSPGADGLDLLLHMGPLAPARFINGVVDPAGDGAEIFRVARAVDATGAPIADTLTVNFSGFLQNLTGAERIVAFGGADDDAVAISGDITVGAFIDGGGGDDVLRGGGGNDEILGGAGDDMLFGGAGDDVLRGGAGADYLEGGAGADILDGGAGFDQVSYETSSAGVRFAIEGEGYRGLSGDALGDVLISIEYVIGSQFDDVLIGNSLQDNTLEGLAGNDILIGGALNDFLIGGAGADTIIGDGFRYGPLGPGRNATSYLTSYGQVQIDLAAGHYTGGDAQGDRLIDIQDVQGSSFDDVLIGDDRANRLDGWLGNDILMGGGGADELYGGAGDDTVYAGADGDHLDGGEGRDLLSYARVARGVTINLGAGIGAGGDAIALRVNAEGLPIAGLSTFEDLDGTDFADALTGDAGANTIRGFDGDDLLDGGDGDDTLIGGRGADELIGGAGVDWADYTDSDGVVVNLQTGQGFGSTAAGDVLSGIENLRGGDGADAFLGDDGDNVLDPRLSGGGVADIVVGGGGTDTLMLDYSRGDFGQGMTGGFGAPGSSGAQGSGVFVRRANDGVTILDIVQFAEMERLHLVGSSRADTITTGIAFGGFGGDFVAAGGGDDVISAGGGADVVLAQEGDDHVTYLVGGGLRAFIPPPFHLDGGRGRDTLSITFGEASRDDIHIRADVASQAAGSVNWTSASGAAIHNFEILAEVRTGAGADRITQTGAANNVFFSGDGQDVLTPGWGADLVDGGADLVQGVEVDVLLPSGPVGGGDSPVASHYGKIIDAQAFFANRGDLLVLDYTGLGGGVTGAVDSAPSFWVEGGVGSVSLILVPFVESSFGAYRDAAGAVDLTFTNIERLDVTGSAHGDRLEGTQDGLRLIDASVRRGFRDEDGAVAARGADILRGMVGDDILIGYSGSDRLYGGDGDDILIGADPGAIQIVGVNAIWRHDPFELDHLHGGAGADVFVLGVTFRAFNGAVGAMSFYGAPIESDGFKSHAVIADFNATEGDTIQLAGDALDYRTRVVNAGEPGVATLIERVNVGGAPQLVARLEGVAQFDRRADYVTYANAGNLGVGGLGGYPDLMPAPPPAPTTAPLVALSSDLPWIWQENDPVALLAALFNGDADGIDHSRDALRVSGDARGFGVFSGDPFGLGEGIALSTGQVVDLDGPNLIDGGVLAPRDIALTFEAAGTFGGARIFRADLSGLGVDIRSLVLRDDGRGEGGSPGRFSGFDLDAVALSRTFLDGVTDATDLNGAALPRLDVFDFSAAYLDLRPGDQRPTTAPILSGPLNGTTNGLVNNGFATLGVFDSSGVVGAPEGSLSLGDGGALGIDLTTAVATDRPLYLYVAESGLGTTEGLSGLITASAGRLAAPADLSTDFGRPGAEDDVVTLDYRFHLEEGSTADTLIFEFALFSEELVEFAGSAFNDRFSLRLNGVELAQLSDGAAATVNNLRAAPLGPGSADLILNPAGVGPAAGATRADAYTRVLSFAGPLRDGENTLVIEARDVRDGLLDSGVLIRAGTVMTGKGLGGKAVLDFQPEPGLVPGAGPSPLGVGLDPDRPPQAAVTLIFTPGDGVDLGNGPGAPLSVTVQPGGALTFDLPVSAVPGAEPATGYGFVGVTTTSDDPAYDGLSVAPLVFEVADPPPLFLTLGDAPERFSRLEPDAWSDAWSDPHVVLTHRASPDGAWSAVDLGTANPGALSGSDLIRGDLGVSGRTGPGGAAPQEIDGTEALRLSLIDAGASRIALTLSGFDVTPMGAESARLTFLSAGGAIVRQAFVSAADGDSFVFADLPAVTDLIVEAGGAAADDGFAPGSFSDGAAFTDFGSAFLIDRVDLWGETWIGG